MVFMDPDEQVPLSPAQQKSAEMLKPLVKTVISPRLYQQLTGQTSPEENRLIKALMLNYKSLPKHVQHQLMNTTLPVGDVVNELKQYVNQNPDQSDQCGPVMAALGDVGTSANPDKLVAERSNAADGARQAEEAKAVEAHRANIAAKAVSEAEEEIRSIFTRERSPELEPTPSHAELNAIQEAFRAFQTRNRIAKAIHIVIYSILGLLASALLHGIGWNWTDWPIIIVLAFFSMGTLYYRGFVPLSWKEWKRYSGHQ
jgi:hypothetical protein